MGVAAMIAAVNGRLMNGVYDLRQDLPLPAKSTGQIRFVVHMESTQKTPTTVESTSTSTAPPSSTGTVGSPSDFTLSIYPPSQTVNPAGGKAMYTVLILRRNFTPAVTLSVSGLPPGAVGSISPNPVSGVSSTVTITAASATNPGTYAFTITGTGGSAPLTRTTTGTLVKG